MKKLGAVKKDSIVLMLSVCNFVDGKMNEVLIFITKEFTKIIGVWI